LHLPSERLTCLLQILHSPTIEEHLVDSDHEDGCENHEGECGESDASSTSHSHPHHGTHSPPDSAIASHLHALDVHSSSESRVHSNPRPHLNGFNGNSLVVLSSHGHNRSASMATTPSLHPPPSIPQSQTAPSLAPRANGHRTHIRRAPSLQLHDASRLGALHLEGAALSPVTPNYRFGVDEHYASHQHARHHGHTPNLHDHSHVHGSGHSREGHSHNMRGLFLHVMAVSIPYLFSIATC
jgi:solute carrier family 30 (zinc transporter), member 5/7